MLVFAFVLAAIAPSANDAHLLTELIGGAAGQRATVDVLTSDDVRRAVELEASRETLGCTASSCLAEIASAMGARFVLYGSLSKLSEDELILTLTIFDSGTGSSGGRRSLRARDLKALVNQIDGAVAALVDQALAAANLTTKTRLLVLDTELRIADPPAPVAAYEPSMWLWMGGGAAAAGALGIGIGAAFDTAAAGADRRARDPKTPQVLVPALFDERDQGAMFAGVGYVVGSVLLVGGAVLVGVGVQQ